MIIKKIKNLSKNKDLMLIIIKMLKKLKKSELDKIKKLWEVMNKVDFEEKVEQLKEIQNEITSLEEKEQKLLIKPDTLEKHAELFSISERLAPLKNIALGLRCIK